MSRILVVGAGSAQVDAIKRVRELGISVVAVDGNPNAPGLKFANIPLVLDIKDVSALINVGHLYRIDGIISFSVEVAVKSVALAAEGLGLPALPVEAAYNSTSKKRMREIWNKSSVPSCRYFVCRTSAETRDAAKEIGFPVVVKPSDSAGSRGVSLVQSIIQLDDSFTKAMQHSNSKEILVEEYMEGEEISVEGFINKGVFYPIVLSDKIRSLPPYLLDIGVFFPSIKPNNIQSNAVKAVNDAAMSLGMDMTPVHAEVMITSQGPKMVEIAARGPGFMVFSVMIPWVSGVDVIREHVKIALGKMPDFATNEPRGAALLFPQAAPGRIVSVDGIEKARSIPTIYDVQLYLGEGDVVHSLQSGQDRLGHIIALADDRSSAEKAVKAAESMLDVRVESQGDSY